MQGRLEGVLSRHSAERSSLIPILQDIQEALGYIPVQAMAQTARYLGIPDSAVYGVVTFYAQFYLARQGKHRIKVCQGTACHVQGGAEILKALEDHLGIAQGQTTEDYRFSLERVACFGSCALAPVMVVDGKVHARMTAQEARKLLEALQ